MIFHMLNASPDAFNSNKYICFKHQSPETSLLFFTVVQWIHKQGQGNKTPEKLIIADERAN